MKGTDSAFLSKPYSFMKKFESLGFMSNENPDEDQDIAANKSSYRKNAYKNVKLELKILFNAIDSQAEKDRNTLGQQFHRAYSKYIKK